MMHDIIFDLIYKLNSKKLKRLMLLFIFPLKPISVLIEKLNYLKVDSGFILIIEKNF